MHTCNVSCENVDSVEENSEVPHLKSNPLDPVAQTETHIINIIMNFTHI
jgi:hypothetical protein